MDVSGAIAATMVGKTIPPSNTTDNATTTHKNNFSTITGGGSVATIPSHVITVHNGNSDNIVPQSSSSTPMEQYASYLSSSNDDHKKALSLSSPSTATMTSSNGITISIPPTYHHTSTSTSASYLSKMKNGNSNNNGNKDSTGTGTDGGSGSIFPVVLYNEHDGGILGEYQTLVRQQLELFEADEHDVINGTFRQGRSTPIQLGQIGLRCKHCATAPSAIRTKGSVYFSQTIKGIYQIAQNMSKVHLCERCTRLPPDIKKRMILLRNRRHRASGGRAYWIRHLRELGIYEDGTVLRARPRENRLKANAKKRKKSILPPLPLSHHPITTVTTITTTDATSTDTSIITTTNDDSADATTIVNKTPSVVAASTSGSGGVTTAPTTVVGPPLFTPTDTSAAMETMTTIEIAPAPAPADNAAVDGRGNCSKQYQ